MTWLDLLLFLILFMVFVYVFATNVITQLHKVYLLFHFFMMLWPFGQIAVHTTDNPNLQLLYVNISYVGMSMLGFGWLLFTKFLINRACVPSRKSIVYMLLPSMLVLIGILWNPEHLFMSAVGHQYEERVYGPIFWAMVLVLLSYYVYSTRLLWRAYCSESLVQDRPHIANALTGIFVIVGFATLDLLLNVVFDKWLPVIPGLTSTGIVISNLYFVFSIRKHRMFDIIKIAQQDVADTMSAGIIVMDEQDYVVEMNRAVNPELRIALGQVFDMVALLEACALSDQDGEFLQTYRLHPERRIQTDIVVRQQDGSFVYLSMHVAPIMIQQRMMGRVITFQDDTELRRLIEESYHQYEALQERNRALLYMQDELLQANQKLEQMAVTDSLTGCFNRRYLMLQLEHEVMTNLRYHIPFAIFLFDIDLFKSVNDTYGHLVGDEVIRRTAEIVRGALRRTDILARYGGEEFAVYLPHTNQEQAEILAQRIRTAVEDNEIAAGKEKNSVSITISIGVLAVEAQHVEEVDDAKIYLRGLFAKADAALYEAKKGGRNRIVNVC